ncbi:unnamed protein product [Acanthoscelides obtectus]|uniref:Uncharacterized protein n=1 Tax=Acanthoscelides obtectus TaxID=200917 RepID=A0A9P0KKS3_ACAOB|nr:unnamed protein product [Acanthoscelides obtectus]CAK1631787.1 hypothetical protein AOBTE_LOCUS7159 [Acanthoscelides obtectus]
MKVIVVLQTKQLFNADNAVSLEVGCRKLLFFRLRHVEQKLQLDPQTVMYRREDPRGHEHPST